LFLFIGDVTEAFEVPTASKTFFENTCVGIFNWIHCLIKKASSTTNLSDFKFNDFQRFFRAIILKTLNWIWKEKNC